MATAIVTASFAWACTNFARVDAINPPLGIEQSHVTLRGAGVAANALVELRWNSLQGQVIGQANSDADGAFSVTGTVPDAAPGVYSIIAVSGQTGVGRAAFETVAASDPNSAQLPVGLNGPQGPNSRLWTGYTSGSTGLDSPAGAPDLALRLGLGILLVGVIGVGVGTAVVSTRRRRVPVAAPDQQFQARSPRT
jgi:hypothetical protein